MQPNSEQLLRFIQERYPDQSIDEFKIQPKSSSSKRSQISLKEVSEKNPEINLEQFRKEPKEKPISRVSRNAARLPARYTEGYLGSTGEIANLGKKVLDTVTNKISPSEETRAGKIVSHLKETHPLQPLFPTKKLPEGHTYGPGTEDFRNLTNKFLGEVSRPHGKIEHALDEYAERIGALTSPGMGVKLGKALGLSAGAQFAKEGLKALGAPPSVQAAGEIGTMIGMSVLSKKNFKEFKNAIQAAEKEALPEKALVSSEGLSSYIDDLERQISKGAGAEGTEAKRAVKGSIDDIRKRIEGALIPVEQVKELKKDVNTKIKDIGSVTGAKKLLLGLTHELEKTMELYGKQSNPKFLKLHKLSDAAHVAEQQSGKLAAKLAKGLNKVHLTPGSAALFATILGHPVAAGTILATNVAAHGIDWGVQLAKNHALRKHVGEALVAAAKDDSKAIAQSIARVQKDTAKIEQEKEQREKLSKKQKSYREKLSSRKTSSGS